MMDFRHKSDSTDVLIFESVAKVIQ